MRGGVVDTGEGNAPVEHTGPVISSFGLDYLGLSNLKAAH